MEKISTTDGSDGHGEREALRFAKEKSIRLSFGSP
jgi:hypothetical protein